MPSYRNDWIRRIEAILVATGLASSGAFFATVSERAWFQWRFHPVDSSPAPAGAAVPRTGPLGRIEIPRVGVSAVIFEGVDGKTLRRGVGHVPGTAYPGEAERRIALAAHRDTFFRNLRFIKAGDIVRLRVPGTTAVYKVESTKVVKPWQADVLLPAEEDVLTLVTCYPFTYLGPAPERFIVHARRM